MSQKKVGTISENELRFLNTNCFQKDLAYFWVENWNDFENEIFATFDAFLDNVSKRYKIV